MSGILRGGFTSAVLLVVGWFVGQAMLDHHVVDTHTQNLIGVAIAVAVIVIGLIVSAVRGRRG